MGWRRHSRWFSLALALSASAVACASSGFDGHVFHNRELRFRVGQVPSSWRPLGVDGTLLAFRDERTNSTVALNGRCGVDGDDVPLASLTQHLFLQFTNREPTSQKALSLDGREALRTEITAALDGVRKRYLVYVLKKNGCVYDFMLIASGDDPGSASDFERFVQGFATLE